ncbi:serine hydrolase [Synechococcus sp. PCC 7336]|uniref:serine hydrolase n=1 Tax=Synechococcus sp. PCC 7336 TaxID=195250 RepID=UPI000375DD0C|nr:serine hydrolase [Synechococcus sp. PCC 7336]
MNDNRSWRSRRSRARRQQAGIAQTMDRPDRQARLESRSPRSYPPPTAIGRRHIPRSRSTSPPSVRGSNRQQPLPLQPPAPRTHQNKRRPPRARRATPPSWQAIASRGLAFSLAIGLSCGLVARRWGNDIASFPEVTTSEMAIATIAPPRFAAPFPPPLQRGQHLSELQARIEGLALNPQLRLGMVVVDVEGRNYANVRGSERFAAASTIKLPILVALLEAVDRGEVRLGELLTLEPSAIVGEAGSLQTQPPGSQHSVLDTATWMIEVSDNTATNLIVNRLGGRDVLNRRFRQWGLQQTQLSNPLPDLEGTNTTSPDDLIRLLEEIERGHLLSMRSRDRLLSIMQRTQNADLLPRGLGPGAIIAHKTGTLRSLLGDVGLVDLPNGRRYAIAVLVARSHSDPEASELIRQVSREVYNYWAARP